MIGKILNDILLNNAGVTNLIKFTNDAGQTDYALSPNVVPQNFPVDAIAYKVLSIESVDTKDDFSGISKYRMQIDLFSKSYDKLEKMDLAVRNAMNKAEGIYTVENYDDTEMSVDVGVSRHDETEDIFFDEVEVHARSTEYTIITNQTP